MQHIDEQDINARTLFRFDGVYETVEAFLTSSGGRFQIFRALLHLRTSSKSSTNKPCFW